jgi:acyl carrier protein
MVRPSPTFQPAGRCLLVKPVAFTSTPRAGSPIWQLARSVKNHCLDQDTLLSQLKHLIADMFRIDIIEPDKIADHEPLVGGRLGLDSLDALELALCIEEVFGIRICVLEESHHAFASIVVLADFILARLPANRTRLRRPPAARIFRPVPSSLSPVWDELPATVGP